MKKIELYVGGYYHIYNRGVDKRVLFLDETDRLKLISGFETFNAERFVKIISYCLMPNHFHIFVQQIEPNGLSKFMQKLGISYTMYFNKRYERKGRLFESKFQRVEVENQAHFLHLSRYIHLNPLDLYVGSINQEAMMDFLKNYQWSSYAFHLGHRAIPDWLEPSDVLDCFTGSSDYENFMHHGLCLKVESHFMKSSKLNLGDRISMWTYPRG